MYRVYLRNDDQSVQLDSKTKTPSAAIALDAFAALAGRSDLKGLLLTAVLSSNGVLMALHRFARSAGDDENRRDFLREGEWPDEQQAHPGSGGARANAGRRAKTTDGGPVRNYAVSLDITRWKALVAYGHGELSEGSRRAARVVMPGED